MKKAIVFVGLIFTSSLILNGQGLKFGVFADPQIAWISPDSRTVDNDGSIFGFSGGLIVDNYFQENYAVGTGIGIGSQGGKLIYEDGVALDVYDEEIILPAGATLEYKINYITVPLGLKLKTNQIGYFSYFARLGMTNQFRIKATGTSGDGQLEKDNIEKEVGLFNLAYHFGGGVEYGISEDTAITLGAVYHNGFLDVTKSSNVKANSRVLAIRVGIIF